MVIVAAVVISQHDLLIIVAVSSTTAVTEGNLPKVAIIIFAWESMSIYTKLWTYMLVKAIY